MSSKHLILIKLSVEFGKRGEKEARLQGVTMCITNALGTYDSLYCDPDFKSYGLTILSDLNNSNPS